MGPRVPRCVASIFLTSPSTTSSVRYGCNRTACWFARARAIACASSHRRCRFHRCTPSAGTATRSTIPLPSSIFPQQSSGLRIASEIVIEIFEDAPLDFLVDDLAVTYPFEYLPDEQADLTGFRRNVYPDDQPRIQDWLAGLGLHQGPIETFVLLDRLNREIAGRFTYRVREEPGVQSPARTLELQQWIVPRFRHPVPRSLPASRVGKPLCQRLSPRTGDRGGPWRDSRLGRGVSAGARLERLRSDYRRGDGKPAHSGRRCAPPAKRTAGGRQFRRPAGTASATDRQCACQCPVLKPGKTMHHPALPDAIRRLREVHRLADSPTSRRSTQARRSDNPLGLP